MSGAVSMAGGRGGRPRQEGNRYPNGQLIHDDAYASRRRDRGTKELREKRLAATGSHDFEINPTGILAGRMLITNQQFSAAQQLRILYPILYRSPHAQGSNLQREQKAFDQSDDFKEAYAKARWKIMREVTKREGFWYDLVRLCVYDEDRFGGLIERVLLFDLHGTEKDALFRHLDGRAFMLIRARLITIRKALQLMADLPTLDAATFLLGRQE